MRALENQRLRREEGKKGRYIPRGTTRKIMEKRNLVRRTSHISSERGDHKGKFDTKNDAKGTKTPQKRENKKKKKKKDKPKKKKDRALIRGELAKVRKEVSCPTVACLDMEATRSSERGVRGRKGIKKERKRKPRQKRITAYQ